MSNKAPTIFCNSWNGDVQLTEEEFVGRWENEVSQFYNLAVSDDDCCEVLNFNQKIIGWARTEFNRLYVRQQMRKV